MHCCALNRDVSLQDKAKKQLEAGMKTGKLDLSSFNLPIFPQDIFAIPNLRNLTLADNQIKVLPKEVLANPEAPHAPKESLPLECPLMVYRGTELTSGTRLEV